MTVGSWTSKVVLLSMLCLCAGDPAFAQSRDLPQGDARGFQPPIDRRSASWYRHRRHFRPYDPYVRRHP